MTETETRLCLRCGLRPPHGYYRKESITLDYLCLKCYKNPKSIDPLPEGGTSKRTFRRASGPVLES